MERGGRFRCGQRRPGPWRGPLQARGAGHACPSHGPLRVRAPISSSSGLSSQPPGGRGGTWPRWPRSEGLERGQKLRTWAIFATSRHGPVWGALPQKAGQEELPGGGARGALPLPASAGARPAGAGAKPRRGEQAGKGGMRAHGAWRGEAGGRGPCAGDPQPPAREAPHELPRPRTEPRAEGLNDYQTRCADDGREGTGKAAEVELKDPGKGWERGRGGAVGPSLQGRGVRTGSPGPAPSSSAASSQLPHLRPVPGEPGFRSGVRSQAPAPANPPLPLGSRPVSAEGRSCRFRRGRAAPHTRMHWPPVRGALALSHSLQGRCGRQRVWWPPSRSTPLSQPTLLCEGPP